MHPDQTREWQLAANAENPEAPVFILAPVTGYEAAGLFAKHRAVDDGDVDGAARCYSETIRAGLRGWRNVTGADGKPAEFKADAKGRPTPETLAVIARDWFTVYALAMEIQTTAMLTRADLGNLKPVS